MTTIVAKLEIGSSRTKSSRSRYSIVSNVEGRDPVKAIARSMMAS